MSKAPAVTLVDTGMGNLRSVSRALVRAGADVQVTDAPSAIEAAERLVVPGQGGFSECASALAGGLGDAISAYIATGRPYFGICLGMQILFDSSEEAPGASGLGIVKGSVQRLDPGADPDEPGRRLKVPHMGWNQVSGAHPLLPSGEWFYFVHSYHCVPDDPALTIGVAEYGQSICAAVARDNIFACQFHPEKSQHAGAAMLRRFVEGTWS